MLKKAITYKTFDGEEVTEDFYFNLTKAEVIEWEYSIDGGMMDHLKRTMATENEKDIMAVMKDVILRSYGKRTSDGKGFVKNQELRDEFQGTEAYSELFWKMCTDAEFASNFFNSVGPEETRNNPEQLKLQAEMAEKLGITPPHTPGDQPRELSIQEAQVMDGDELRSGLATGKYILTNSQ